MQRSFFLALALSLLALTSSAQQRPRRVAILVFEGVELLDFAGPGEVFAAAGHGAFDVFTVADDEGPVSSMGFLSIVPEFTIDDCPKPDVIVVPGGAVPATNQRLQAWVAKHRRTGELTMSVCNGAALLAAAGVLEGLEVTTHHNTFDSVLGFEPTAKALVNRRFVDHGALITTAGISAGIDGSLHVVSRLLGKEVAQATATYMEYDWRPEEIADLHAKEGLRYDRQAEQLLSAIETQGMQAAVAGYRAGLAKQTESDRTLPGERRLRAMAQELMNRDEVEPAILLLELTVAAHPRSERARQELGRARELAELLASDAELTFVFSCPPCGGACDAQEYEQDGNCPHCGMALARRVLTGSEPATRGD